jgi:hypothetical protein
VGDGILNASPDVRFELLWRRAGAADTSIVAFEHQYPTGTAAQYEESHDAARVEAGAGDLLVLKVTMLSADPNALYIPISEHAPTPTARFLTVDVP